MNIEYLTVLRDNPEKGSLTNEPITLGEIETLEALYNGGQVFPKAVRELLFLAGAYCIIFDYGLYNNQQEMQEAQRDLLDEVGMVISRPFYVIDVYNDGDTFLMVYLDEGDDPPVYSWGAPPHGETGGVIDKIKEHLSSLTSKIITERLNKGLNPF